MPKTMNCRVDVVDQGPACGNASQSPLLPCSTVHGIQQELPLEFLYCQRFCTACTDLHRWLQCSAGRRRCIMKGAKLYRLLHKLVTTVPFCGTVVGCMVNKT